MEVKQQTMCIAEEEGSDVVVNCDWRELKKEE